VSGRAPKPAAGPLLAAAELFDTSLQRFAALAAALQKVTVDSQRGLERAGETLQAIADCEQEMQAHAQALMAALTEARTTQQRQAEAISARAEEIRGRTETYAGLMRRFEALGQDAAGLNTTAQELAARKQTRDEMVRDPELIAGLDDLQARMATAGAAAETLTADARVADFDDLSRRVDSLRQQMLATRNKLGLLREALTRAAPAARPS
jgi:septal ring factor EnvC (AmiA/AmiB activator)